MMVPLIGPFPHRTRPPEINPYNESYYVHDRNVINNARTVSCPVSSLVARIRTNSDSLLPVVVSSPNKQISNPSSIDPSSINPSFVDPSSVDLSASFIMSPVVERQRVAEVNTQPGRASDYSAYVPVHLERVKTAAYVDSGNTLANVISPQTMAAMGITEDRLEPVPQLFVGTAAAGKAMRVLGQAPRVELTFGSHPAKFCIRPLVLQGLVHPLNLRGAFLAHCGIDRLHSKGALQIQGKEVLMYHP